MSVRTKASFARAVRSQALLAAAVALCLSRFSSPAAATPSLVQNGQFLQTTLSSPGGYVCQAGSSTCTSTVANWTSACNGSNGCGNGATVVSLLFSGTNGSAFNGGIGLWGTIANSPDGGNTFASDGDPTYRAPLSQTISGLTVNDTYVLQFDQAAAQQNGTNGATTERWQVTLGSSVQLSPLMNNLSHGVVGWTKQTLSFVASAVSETLSFLAVGTPAGEPPVVLLSAVSLSDTSTPTGVPEPGSLLLIGGGVLALAVTRKRFWKSAIAA